MHSTLTHTLSVHRQTRMEEATRTYLWGKALQLSGQKRKADAAV